MPRSTVPSKSATTLKRTKASIMKAALAKCKKIDGELVDINKIKKLTAAKNEQTKKANAARKLARLDLKVADREMKRALAQFEKCEKLCDSSIPKGSKWHVKCRKWSHVSHVCDA